MHRFQKRSDSRRVHESRSAPPPHQPKNQGYAGNSPATLSRLFSQLFFSDPLWPELLGRYDSFDLRAVIQLPPVAQECGRVGWLVCSWIHSLFSAESGAPLVGPLGGENTVSIAQKR